MSPPSDVDVKLEFKPTLTPPASEEADKHDESGSELSDLELDGDNSGEIIPDHYYAGGKIPVFKPVSFLFNKITFGFRTNHGSNLYITLELDIN